MSRVNNSAQAQNQNVQEMTPKEAIQDAVKQRVMNQSVGKIRKALSEATRPSDKEKS